MDKKIKNNSKIKNYKESEGKNMMLSDKELEELFNCTDLTKKIDPKLINCKNWTKPGIARRCLFRYKS